MNGNYHTVPLLLLIGIVMFYSTPAGYSQSSGCYFTAMNLYGPPSVQEGQKLEVHILFSVTCTGLGNYTIRADLVDGRTGQILSSNRTTYAILGPFAAVLTNQVVAPMTVGWWSLQLNLYMLDSNGVPVGPQSQQVFGLTITSSTTTLVIS